jgi:MerC mercury resistance protein
METPRLEEIGSIGAVVAAAACPICFPKLALIGALFGLGAFSAYEYQFLIAALVLVGLAAAGHLLSYRRHRNRWLLGSALAGASAVFTGLYVAGSELLVYAGLAALVAASSADLWRRIRPKAGPVLDSEITCPKCGVRRKERMRSDACQFFYECRGCGALLRPKQGDCCVFCSYGSVKCPPTQLA